MRDLIVAGTVVLVFFLFLAYLEIKHYNIVLSIILGALLVLGSNFIQGVSAGFYAPIAGDARSGTLIPNSTDGQEYYHDALRVTDSFDFLRHYNEIQPTLHQHSHTHPPGAVLTFYFLEKWLRNPALIAIAVMLIAIILSCFFVYKILLIYCGSDIARYGAFLFTLLPAVQIYYLATLDAIVAALLTGTLYLFCFGVGKRAVVGAVFMLVTAFLLTFVSLFILPVLVVFELITRRQLNRSLILIGGVIFAHLILYLFTGYNAVESFHTATIYENPKGFMLLVDPVNYFFTRLEDVAEIILFFGPFLFVLFIRGIKGFDFQPLHILTILGCVTLLLMYITGAWRTGETARACIFIYPYLLFPVCRYLKDNNVNALERRQLAFLVFFQSVAMQTFGHYHW